MAFPNEWYRHDVRSFGIFCALGLTLARPKYGVRLFANGVYHYAGELAALPFGENLSDFARRKVSAAYSDECRAQAPILGQLGVRAELRSGECLTIRNQRHLEKQVAQLQRAAFPASGKQ
jgi:hypothetical protein